MTANVHISFVDGDAISFEEVQIFFGPEYLTITASPERPRFQTFAYRWKMVKEVTVKPLNFEAGQKYDGHLQSTSKNNPVLVQDSNSKGLSSVKVGESPTIYG